MPRATVLLAVALAWIAGATALLAYDSTPTAEPAPRRGAPRPDGPPAAIAHGEIEIGDGNQGCVNGPLLQARTVFGRLDLWLSAV